MKSGGQEIMHDDPELEMNEDEPEEGAYLPRKRKTGLSGNNKLLPVLLAILVVVLLAGGIFYFMNGRSARDEADQLRSKMTAFEQKIASLERQITDLQGKSGTAGPDPILVQRLDALTQKIEALENRPQPQSNSKAKSPSPKPAVTPDKRYHTVQKGETLYKISKKYEVSMEKLRKLNNLSPDQSVKTGQKLLVSPEE